LSQSANIQFIHAATIFQLLGNIVFQTFYQGSVRAKISMGVSPLPFLRNAHFRNSYASWKSRHNSSVIR